MKKQVRHFFWESLTVSTYFLLLLVAVVIGLIATHELADRELSEANIKLTLSAKQYQVGDSIKFTLDNMFDSDVYVINHCPDAPLLVYRWQESHWQHAISHTNPSVCPYQERLIKVPAKSKISSDYNSWKDLFNEPGLYRIVAEVENYRSYPFQDFIVVSKDGSQTSPSQTSPAPSSGTINNLPGRGDQQPAEDRQNDDDHFEQ